MCGRFTLTVDGEVVQSIFGLEAAPANHTPRYNIAPSQAVNVITNTQPKTLTQIQWGLVPSWAKQPDFNAGMINARSETAHEKPTFRDAMRSRRCLIPADGWYEWGRDKTPMYIHMPDHEVFAFAGLWEMWRGANGQTVTTCAILTTDATEQLRDVHHRMPVVLRRDEYDTWLHERQPDKRRDLLRSYTDKPFEVYAVSKQVNKPANDTPDNIMPYNDGLTQLSLF